MMDPDKRADVLLRLAKAAGQVQGVSRMVESNRYCVDVLNQIAAVQKALDGAARIITRNYLGGPESGADGYAMPAHAVVDGLCPVVLINAEYDDLRASSEAFAAQLATAGVDVRQVMAPGMLHGFLNLTSELPPVDRALALMADVVATAGVPTGALVSA